MYIVNMYSLLHLAVLSLAISGAQESADCRRPERTSNDEDIHPKSSTQNEK